jgi:hypothetical protein
MDYVRKHNACIVTKELINPIIGTRTRHFRHAYHPTRDSLECLAEREDGLPRNNGGTSRIRGANLSRHESLSRDDRLPRSNGGRYIED